MRSVEGISGLQAGEEVKWAIAPLHLSRPAWLLVGCIQANNINLSILPPSVIQLRSQIAW